MPLILAQPTWVMPDLAPLILGCPFAMMWGGVLIAVVTLLIRSGGRAWRPALLVGLGCILSWALFPALFDYGWMKTVFAMRIIVPGAIGCLGIVCMAWGLRAMLRFGRSL
jgi:hypothetical protein